jgi:SAM-dependent methyltransferase
MLRLNGLNDFEYRRLTERLDKAVAAAARDYLRHLYSGHVQIRPDDWDEELDELRLAREPDYSRPGVPLVYALKYMPRRVISILGSLLAVDLDRYPTTVLDVGSGPGATALALDLINAPRHMNLLGIEPSPEMIAFADSSRFTLRVTTRYQEGSLADGTLGRLPLETVDLIVLSASFPYGFDEWEPLLDALGSHEQNLSTMIVAIEPEAKVDILQSFGRRLRARGWPTETFCCHDLPEVIKRDDVALKDTQEVWKRIGSPGSVPPRTWWNLPDDKFLIANPKPAWPMLGEGRMVLGDRHIRPRPLSRTGQPMRPT